MNNVIQLLVLLVVATSCFAQTQVTEMKSLVGRKAVAQRMPFYQPGTYQQIPNTYAGQTVTIIDVKPSAIVALMPKLTAREMASLPAESRANIENVLNAATIVVQFADGTKADTGGLPVMPSMLPSYLEVIPDPAASSSIAAAGDPSPTPTPTPTPANPISPASATTDLAISSGEMLSDDQVQLALSGIGKDHAVAIMDGWPGSPSLTPHLASITLFMPEAVLAYQSASAKSQFIKYVPSDEEKRKSLIIYAHGRAGSNIQDGCTSVTRVVLLSDPSGHVMKEPYLSEPSTQVWRNGFGATNECDDFMAKFSLKDVQQVKGAAPNGEFFVAVFSGAVNTKTYKVKSKYQAKLGLK
ncbi:MAG TPA: hypothetical protein VK302_22880 [Terriglobales bacterium]|nr:hypothetical protein [Terriglobales bacterium]